MRMLVFPLMKPLQSLQNSFFRLDVHRGKGIIQDEEGRIHRESPGQWQSSAFVLRIGLLPFSPTRVFIPSGNPIISSQICAMPRRLLRSLRLVASSLPKAMFSRIVSEKRKVSCGTYPIGSPQHVKRNLMNLNPIEEEMPLGRFQDPCHEIAENRLSGSGPSHDDHSLSRLDGEIECLLSSGFPPFPGRKR